MQMAGGSDTSAEGWKQGKELLAAGQASEAVAALQPWVQANPEGFEGHNYLGVALAQVGRQEEAVASLQRANRLNPDSAIAHFNLGVVFEKMGQNIQAREQFQTAIQLDPKHTGAQVALAKLDTGFGSTSPATSTPAATTPSGFEGTSWSTATTPATETLTASQKAVEARHLKPGFLNVLGGLAAGFVAAIICAIIWDKLSYYTGYQIGYVAVGIGFVVGTAVVLGAGKKYGVSLQIIAALLSLFGIVLGETLLLMDSLRDYIAANPAAGELKEFNTLGLFLLSLMALPESVKESPMSILFAVIGLWCGWSAPAKPKDEEEGYPEATVSDAPPVAASLTTAGGVIDAPPAATVATPTANTPADGPPR